MCPLYLGAYKIGIGIGIGIVPVVCVLRFLVVLVGLTENDLVVSQPNRNIYGQTSLFFIILFICENISIAKLRVNL